VPSSCALLGRFAIGARVPWLQHNPNAKCQQVLVLALRLVNSSNCFMARRCYSFPQPCSLHHFFFWGVTVCKMFRPTLSDHCLSCLPVCDVGALWPNGRMDQHETWCGGMPRPRPDCVRWGPSSPIAQKRGHWGTAPNFRPTSVVANGWMD